MRAGSAIRARFGEINEQTIDAVLGGCAAGCGGGAGATGARRLESGCAGETQCRALGILRGRAAVPDVVEALPVVKDNSGDGGGAGGAAEDRAIRKLGPRVTSICCAIWMIKAVQGAAIETAGVHARSRDAFARLCAAL